ncbi:MAG TPA: hypothetical protein VMI56_27865 [Reyranella sp.]|nr:hypothetical protein [Reyranella sp.]
MTIQPDVFHLEDDGETPNNPRLPLVLYRKAVDVDGAADPAALFEQAFHRHGWAHGWRAGIFDFLHFHPHGHEVLGIARGTARVQFGGAKGIEVDLAPGDVAILPAGTGHRRLSSSRDLLVVGAYPAGSDSAHARSARTDHAAITASVASTPTPDQDPLYGRNGPMTRLWR